MFVTELVSWSTTRGLSWHVDGVRNDNVFLAHTFTKLLPFCRHWIAWVQFLGSISKFIISTSSSDFQSVRRNKFRGFECNEREYSSWTNPEQATHLIQPFIYTAFTTATTIDMIIASAMCYYLNWSRSSFIGWVVVTSEWLNLDSESWIETISLFIEPTTR
jgi:hypothetical protein